MDIIKIEKCLSKYVDEINLVSLVVNYMGNCKYDKCMDELKKLFKARNKIVNMYVGSAAFCILFNLINRKKVVLKKNFDRCFYFGKRPSGLPCNKDYFLFGKKPLNLRDTHFFCSHCLLSHPKYNYYNCPCDNFYNRFNDKKSMKYTIMHIWSEYNFFSCVYSIDEKGMMHILMYTWGEDDFFEIDQHKYLKK